MLFCSLQRREDPYPLIWRHSNAKDISTGHYVTMHSMLSQLSPASSINFNSHFRVHYHRKCHSMVREGAKPY